MSTKQEAINSFQSDKTYLGSHVRFVINNISTKKENETPNKIKKGDCYLSYIGVKKRPCVIVKVLKDYIIGIPLTSGDNIHSLVPYNCRFKGEGYLTNTIDVVSIEHVKENFGGVLEDKKAIKLGIESIKQLINGIK